MYLLYAVLFFWLRSYVYIWRHSSEYDVVWLNNPRLVVTMPPINNAVVTYHGPLNLTKAGFHSLLRWLYYTVFGWIEWLGIRRHHNSVFTAVSREIIEALHSYGIDKEQTALIWNGVDVEQFAPGNGCDSDDSLWDGWSRDVFIYVGRLSPEKGPLRLLRAFKTMQSNHPEENLPGLVIIGDGPVRAEIETYVDVHDLSYVHCAGYLNYKKLPAVFGSADYFVLPSQYEGAALPLSLCEALASGLPAFVADIEPLAPIMDKEFVTPVPFDNVRVASNLLYGGRMTCNERRHMGEQARAFSAEELSWERRAELYLDVFRTIQNASKP